MKKKFYVVTVVHEEMGVQSSCGGIVVNKTDVPLNWTDGMVGAMPVFTNKKKALKYVKDTFPNAGGAQVVLMEQKFSSTKDKKSTEEIPLSREQGEIDERRSEI